MNGNAGITFLDIGRRLRVLGEEYDENQRRSAASVENSIEHHRSKGIETLNLAEDLALQNLALAMEPKTLQDAAVQMGCFFLAVQRMSWSDLPTQAKNGELQMEMEIAERVVAGVTSVLCREAGVDPNDTGSCELSRILAAHCPSHVYEGD